MNLNNNVYTTSKKKKYQPENLETILLLKDSKKQKFSINSSEKVFQNKQFNNTFRLNITSNQGP